MSALLSLTEARARAEIDALRDRIEELEGLLGLRQAAGIPGLTAMQNRMAGCFTKRRFVTKNFLMIAMWGGDSEHVDARKSVDVWIFRVRLLLRTHDIEIRTIWGEGYAISADDQRRIIDLIERSQP